jgi:hypothetical protein
VLDFQEFLDGPGFACVQSAVASGFSIDDFKNITAGVSSAVTALAVGVGGGWAYFKFFKGRTFRPRLGVRLGGHWQTINGSDVLHARVQVTNIGAAKVCLKQYGSGLEVSFPAAKQEEREVNWESVRRIATEGDGAVAVFEVLTEHAWIEPGETVSDDLMLNLSRGPEIVRLELRLIWNTTGDTSESHPNGDVEVFARQILPPDAQMIDSVASVAK